MMWKKWCASSGQEPIHVGKKGGRPAQCLLMMTNLAADVTLIILPFALCSPHYDSGDVMMSIFDYIFLGFKVFP